MSLSQDYLLFADEDMREKDTIQLFFAQDPMRMGSPKHGRSSKGTVEREHVDRRWRAWEVKLEG